MSLQVKFPFGRGQGPLHTCRSCGFGTRHRVLFERHTKRCPAEVQRTAGLRAAPLTSSPPPAPVPPSRNLPLPPVCRNYKCGKCPFTTNKSRVFLFHQREVHGENITIYVCDHCEYASRHKNKVWRHRRLVHKDAAPLDEIPSETDLNLQRYVASQEGQGARVDRIEHGNRLHHSNRPGNQGQDLGDGGQDLSNHVYEHGGHDEDLSNQRQDPDDLGQDLSNRSRDHSNQRRGSNPQRLPLGGMTGGSLYVSPSTQGEDRYVVYNDGNHSNIDYEGEEDMVEESDDATNQNPDPTENAYDYIVKGSEYRPESPVYKCRLCYYSNPHKWKIANHIRTIHMKKTLFKCPFCDFVCERKIEWCVHKTSHTNKVVYSCQECQYRTTMKRNFDRHQARHRSGGPIKCGMCSYSSTGEAAIQRHMAEYHPAPPRGGATPPYVARDPRPERQEAPSPAHSGRDQLLGAHGGREQPVGAHGGRDQPLALYRPGRYSPGYPRDQSPYRRQENSPYHLPPENLSSPAKSWAGPSLANSPVKLPPRFCRTPDQPERINSFSPLSPSSPTLSNSPDVLCPICGLNVKTESKLKIHMVSHSSAATWSCPMCPLRYKRAADLNRHMKRKHAIRLCDYRNGAGAGAGGLQDQPLNLCVKPGPGSEDDDWDQPLDLSMKASAPSPPPPRPLVYKPENLKCSHCSYLAKWPSDLRRHMLVHSIEKRFRCQYCNKKYKYQFDLNMHLRKSHKIPAGRTRIGTLSLLTNQRPATKAPAITISPDSSGGSSPETTPAKVRPAEVKVAEKGPDSLKCTYCKYVGKYRAEVERHMRLHTGKKPYHCLYCVYKSFWKGDMKRHLQKHHGDDIEGSGRDIKALVNQTFRPSDEEPSEEASGAPYPAASQAAGEAAQDPATLDEEDLLEYKALLDEDQSAPFSLAYPTYPEFGQTVFPGMEPNNNATGGVDKTPGTTAISPGGNSHSPGGRDTPMDWEDNNNSPQKAPGRERHPEGAPGDGEGDTEMEEGDPETLSDPKKVCKCPRCPFVCEAPSKLKCHMEIHDNLKRFMCPHCGKRSNWLWDVRKHIRKDHPRAAMEVTEMSEEEARGSLDVYLLTHRLTGKSGSKERSLSPPGEGDSPTDLSREAHDSSILNQMLSMGVQIKQEPQEDEGYHRQGASQARDMPVFPAPVAMAVTTTATTASTPAPTLKLPKHVAVGRYRPFKCGKCGRRSNWRWDLNKHIRQAHGTAKVIVLSEEEARDTFHECLQAQVQGGGRLERPAAPPSPPTGRYRPYKCSRCNRRSNWKWDMNKHIRSVHPDARLIELSEAEARATYHEVEPHSPQLPPSVPANMIKLSPNSKTSLTQDIHKLKRFKCSGCPYRSNFRSDIGRHIKRKHRRSATHVEVLDLDLAAATLAEYKHTWAKKKFVPSPAKSPGRRGAEFVPKQEPGSPLASLEPRTLSNRGRVPALPRGNQLGALRAKVWRCSKCTFKDRNKKVVVKHFRTHSDGTAFMCRVCGDTTDYRSTLVRHVRTKHHREDLVNCIIETAIQDSSEPLMEVQRQAAPPGDSLGNNSLGNNSPAVAYVLKHYSCVLCGMDTGDQREARDHVASQHPGADWDQAMEEMDKITPAPPEEPPTTPQGGARGLGASPRGQGSSPRGQGHSPRVRVRTENTQKSLACKHCPYRTNKQGLLKIHSTYHRPQPGNKYKCKYCEYYVCASRLLHQHQALHEREHREQGVSYRELEGEPCPPALPCPPRQAPAPQRPASRARHFCDKCPYVSINKNDFIYHKQFHRPRPSAVLRCDHCPYWVSLKRLMTQHMKVHTTQYKLQYYPADMLRDLDLSVAPSPPPRGGESSEDEDDAVHVADLKQSIITSKITSVPITPEKLRPDSPGLDGPLPESPARDEDSVLVLSTAGRVLSGSSYRRHHRCRHCPYVNVRAANLRLHEAMHGATRAGDHRCHFCTYRATTKGPLSQHIRVHSREYRPGEDEIHDVEEPSSPPGGADSPPEDPPQTKHEFAFPERQTVACDPAKRVDASKLPQSMEYYVKYDDSTGEHLLEKATLKKWCCEKCPYATMKRSQFEKHVMLHGSGQKYSCEFCDYSVPGYHLLLQHKRLHLMPNPNLLSVQSISNLQRLPEVPADVAAASNYPNTTNSSTTTPETKAKSGKSGVPDSLEMYENSAEFSEPKKLYRCDRCPYTNIRRDHLLSHLKFHMIHSDMQCPHCDYSVTKVHLLNQHIKVHFNTPGGEMNALPASTASPAPAGKGKSPLLSPRGQAEAKGKVGEKRQPEFIDIEELGKTMDDSGDTKGGFKSPRPVNQPGKPAAVGRAEVTPTKSEVTPSKAEVTPSKTEVRAARSDVTPTKTEPMEVTEDSADKTGTEDKKNETEVKGPKKEAECEGDEDKGKEEQKEGDKENGQEEKPDTRKESAAGNQAKPTGSQAKGAENQSKAAGSQAKGAENQSKGAWSQAKNAGSQAKGTETQSNGAETQKKDVSIPGAESDKPVSEGERESAEDARVGDREPEGGDTRTSWVCQYCDRNFAASEKLLRHEMQHLVGAKF